MQSFIVNNLGFILTQLISLVIFFIGLYMQVNNIKKDVDTIKETINNHETELKEYIAYKRELIDGIHTIKTHAEYINKLNISIEKLITKIDYIYDKEYKKG